MWLLGKVGRLLVAGLCLAFVVEARATTIPVSPGDSSVLTFPIRNNVDSVDSADIEISVELPPALEGHFSIDGTASDLGPALVPTGESRNFSLAYTIGPDAPEGEHTVNLRVGLTNVKFEPVGETLDSSVSLSIDNTVWPVESREIHFFNGLA